MDPTGRKLLHLYAALILQTTNTKARLEFDTRTIYDRKTVLNVIAMPGFAVEANSTAIPDGCVQACT